MEPSCTELCTLLERYWEIVGLRLRAELNGKLCEIVGRHDCDRVEVRVLASGCHYRVREANLRRWDEHAHDESGDDETDDDEVDTTAREYGHSREYAMSVISRDPELDLYEEEGTNAVFCYRVKDSDPTAVTGNYDRWLVPKVKEVLGRDPVDELGETKWFCGVEMHKACDTSRSFHPFFGCLCNQNPSKKQGLKRRFGMRDAKTNIIFLYGRCCVAKQQKVEYHEVDKLFDEPVAIGHRKKQKTSFV